MCCCARFFGCLINHVQDLHNLLLGHSLRRLVEAIKSGIDQVDEIVRCIAVLKAAGDTVIVHLGNEYLELGLSEQSITVGIAAAKRLVNLLLELDALLLAFAHRVSVSVARSLLLLCE